MYAPRTAELGSKADSHRGARRLAGRRGMVSRRVASGYSPRCKSSALAAGRVAAMVTPRPAERVALQQHPGPEGASSDSSALRRPCSTPSRVPRRAAQQAAVPLGVRLFGKPTVTQRGDAVQRAGGLAAGGPASPDRGGRSTGPKLFACPGRWQARGLRRCPRRHPCARCWRWPAARRRGAGDPARRRGRWLCAARPARRTAHPGGHPGDRARRWAPG